MTISCTGAVTVSPAGLKNNQQGTATLTITNSGAAAVYVLSVNPTAGALATDGVSTSGQQHSINLGTAEMVPGQPVVVAASGTATTSWGVLAFQSDSTPIDQAYGKEAAYLGATFTVTDGTDKANVTATPCRFSLTEYTAAKPGNMGSLKANQYGDNTHLVFSMFF